jgi:hypothetical protein
MKPHPRIRKTVKWGGAAVTLLLVAAWIASRWRTVSFASGHNDEVGLTRGLLDIYIAEDRTAPSLMPEGWGVGWPEPASGRPHWSWGLWWGQDSLSSRRVPAVSVPRLSVAVPLWALAGISLLVTLTAWRLEALARRRSLIGLCPKCHYDRAGLAADAKCPECGSASP